MLRYRPLEEKAETARLVERHVLPQLGAGTMQVPVAATYPLDNVAEAYAAFEKGGKLGKIVLTMNEPGE
jgi:NADPH:quinone reductase-like Zn-dependent oxidoreductase